jgi:hypothetical protein
MNGNILTDFAWGEYVIWQMAQMSKIFIDGRYDTVYPSEVIDDYLAFQFGPADSKNVLRKYPHDFILLNRNDQAALAVVEAAPGWKRVYSDGSCILFARANSAAAKIPVVELSFEQTPPSDFP